MKPIYNISLQDLSLDQVYLLGRALATVQAPYFLSEPMISALQEQVSAQDLKYSNPGEINTTDGEGASPDQGDESVQPTQATENRPAKGATASTG